MTALSSFKAFLSRYKLHILSFIFVLLFTGATTVFAVYPGTQWQPGETLDPGAEDPDCTPGSSNCSVNISSGELWSENGSDIYFDTGKVGIGTDSPLANLHILVTQTLIPGEDAIPGTVGETSYTGDGSSDAVIGGQYDGELEGCQILVAIADTAPGNGLAVDRFTWGYGGGGPDCNGGNSGDPIEITPGIAQDVVDGITVTFNNGTGHAVLVMGPELNNYYSAEITPGTPGTDDEYVAGDDPFLITDEDDNTLFSISATGEATIKRTVNSPGAIFTIRNYNDDPILRIHDTGAVVAGSFSITDDSFAINSVAYSWPSSQAAADGYVLTNDGNGTLTWEEAGGGSSVISIGASGNTLYSSGLSGTGEGNTGIGGNIFLGELAGTNASNAYYSNFLGIQAGANATDAHESNFLGYYAGNGATGGANSNFFGSNAGQDATDAYYSNFLGIQAGANAKDANNSNFFGIRAGYNATDASGSNFIGPDAGNGATTAYYANFIGIFAGQNATNANNSNFIGSSAGSGATAAYYANFIGISAGINATDANIANFIGLGAGESATDAHDSNFFGTYAGRYASSAYGANFIGHNAGYNAEIAFNANFIGSTAGRDATNANNSNFIGTGAGHLATNANNSNFLGYSAGENSPDAAYSNFFGNQAGYASSDAVSSNFIGYQAGKDASNAAYSNFIGRFAGLDADDSIHSNFIGTNAGEGASFAEYSNFLGYYAGWATDDADHSNFIGYQAGRAAFNSEYSNFIGAQAGYGAGNAAHSIFIGYQAGLNDTADNTLGGTSILIGDNTTTNGYENSIAIGAGAGNTSSNEFLVDDDYDYFNFNGVKYLMPSVQGGASTFLKNNTGTLSWENTSTLSPISVGTSGNTLYSSGLTSTGQGDSNNIILGEEAGNSATNASYSNFLGTRAGNGATNVSFSNFFGFNSGLTASSASNSNFLGNSAGSGATSASDSNFFGILSGQGATSASDSNFFGPQSGRQASSASYSNFLGRSAGNTATNASYSNFLGNSAGSDATNASHSNFFGKFAGQYATNASNSTFIGENAGRTDQATLGSVNSNNSIFIGKNAGYKAGDFTLDNSPAGYFSILIGDETSTGGYENSIALGRGATNTASHQFVVGTDSADNGISSMKIIGDTIECTITVGTGIGCSSDERLKTNIVDITDALDKILNLRTVTYNWNNQPNENSQIGFLAQDLEQYFPELVATNEKGIKSVYYSQITPVLVQAIRELDLKISHIQEITDQTFKDRLIAWLGDVTNGITHFFADRVQTKELCVEDVCVTRDQFLQIIENSGQEPSGNGSSSGIPVENPIEEVIPEEQGGEGVVEEENPPVGGEEILVPEVTTEEEIVPEPEVAEEPVSEPVPEPTPEIPSESAPL